MKQKKHFSRKKMLIIVVLLLIIFAFVKINEEKNAPKSTKEYITDIWDMLIEESLYDSTNTSNLTKNYFYENQEKKIKTYILINTSSDSIQKRPDHIINFEMEGITWRKFEKITGSYNDLTAQEKKAFKENLEALIKEFKTKNTMIAMEK